MAVNSDLYKVAYATDGTTGPFAITFPVRLDDANAARDIVVYYRTAAGVEADITSTCTIAGLNVTLGTAYVAGGKITIARDPDLKQLSTYSYGTKFPASQFENDMDYAMYCTQKVYSETARSLKAPITDDDAILTIPDEDARRGKFLAFDSDTGLPMASEGSGTPASAYMATVLDDETASEAQATLEVMSIATAIKRSIQLSKPVGELFYLEDYVAPKAFDSAAALVSTNMQRDIYFPAKCIDVLNTYEDITTTNYPYLVPKLRAKTFEYLKGLTGAASTFTLTTWAISSNVATLTFANTAPENAVLALIAEIKLAIDDYPVVTIGATIGNIPAGDYRITGCTPGSRTITFACPASNGTDATTDTVTFFPHKVVGSTTSARVYGANGMALMSAGTSTHMSGGLRRSFGQGHRHDPLTATDFMGTSAGSNAFTSGGGAYAINYAVASTGNPITDGTNGTPRTGAETEPRSLTAHLYIWAGDYIAS